MVFNKKVKRKWFFFAKELQKKVLLGVCSESIDLKHKDSLNSLYFTRKFVFHIFINAIVR